MPTNNKKKGKKNALPSSRNLTLKEDGQEYAKVIKKLGDRRMSLSLCDGSGECVGRVRGSMRKKVWVNPNDYVLICRRDFDENVDIIHLYSEDEVRKLKKMKEIDTSEEAEKTIDSFVIENVENTENTENVIVEDIDIENI